MKNFLSYNLNYYDKYESKVENIEVKNSYERYFGKGYYRIYIKININEIGFNSSAYKDLCWLEGFRYNYLSYYDEWNKGYEVYSDAQKITTALRLKTNVKIIDNVKVINICNTCSTQLESFKPLCKNCRKKEIKQAAEKRMLEMYLEKQEERRKLKQKRTHSVYILKIKKTDRYKIGISCNVNSRVSSINTSSPFNVEFVHSKESDIAYKLEKYLHKEFDDKRLDGEWFKLNNEDLNKAIQLINQENA